MNLAKAGTIFDYVNSAVLAGGAGAFIIFLMLGISTDVVLRYFFHKPILWMCEVSGYLLVYITFLGTAWLLKMDGHVRMDLVITRLRPRVRLYLDIITSIIGTITCLGIVWYGVRATWAYFQVGFTSPTAFEFPMTPMLAVIPAGFFLLFLQFLRKSYNYCRSGESSGDQEKGLPANH